MRDQKQRIVQHKVGRRHRQHDPGHPPDHKRQHEGHRPHHRQFIADAAAVHREQPVEHLGARGDRDDHRGDPEKAVDAGARSHREKVVQPHDIGQYGDDHRGVDHRGIAKQALARKCRGYFRKHPEDRQDQDVDFGMAPDPDKIDVHHRAAAEIVAEEIGADVAIQAEHREHRGQHRKRRDDQHIGAQRGPHEHRHAHHGHARRTQFDDRGDQVDPRQRRAHARNLQRPDVVIDPDAGAVGQARQRRIGQPPGLREFADEQRCHDQRRARCGHPEAEIVEERERHVARTDLQRHDKVHQPGHERHRHEKDHDHAVRGEHLVIVVRRQEPLVAVERHRLLQTHQHRIGKPAQKHHQPEHHIHHADLLVIDGGEPFLPQIAPEAEIGQRRQQRAPAERNHRKGGHDDRFVQRQRIKRQPAHEGRPGHAVRRHIVCHGSMSGYETGCAAGAALNEVTTSPAMAARKVRLAPHQSRTKRWRRASARVDEAATTCSWPVLS